MESLYFYLRGVFVMSDFTKNILKDVFNSYSEGESCCSIKMPQASKIHELNMALKELVEKGFIDIQQKNLCVAKVVLTDLGLEFCMENFFE